jgi:hypothetical protein
MRLALRCIFHNGQRIGSNNSPRRFAKPRVESLEDCSLYEILAVFCTEISSAIPSMLDMNLGPEQRARDLSTAGRPAALFNATIFVVAAKAPGKCSDAAGRDRLFRYAVTNLVGPETSFPADQGAGTIWGWPWAALSTHPSATGWGGAR